MGGVKKPTKVELGNLVTLLIDEPGAERVLLTDARCIDALKRRTEHPEAVIATRDPLGAAILLRSVGERCEYRDGNCVKVAQILAIAPGPVL